MRRSPGRVRQRSNDASTPRQRPYGSEIIDRPIGRSGHQHPTNFHSQPTAAYARSLGPESTCFSRLEEARICLLFHLTRPSAAGISSQADAENALPVEEPAGLDADFPRDETVIESASACKFGSSGIRSATASSNWSSSESVLQSYRSWYEHEAQQKRTS